MNTNSNTMRSVQFVFITGLAGDAEHWNPDFIAEILQKIPNSKGMTVDFQGAGKYLEHIAPIDMTKNVDHIRQQVQESCGPNSKVILVAESLGGMAAIHWALKYPADIEGLVLINTSLGSFSPFYHRLRPSVYPKLVKAHLLAKSPEERDKSVHGIIINDHQAREKHFSRTRKVYEERAMKVHNVILQLLSAVAFFPKKSRQPKVPMLFLVGNGDQLVNPICTKVIHRKWGGKLAVHPTAGHMLATDDSKWASDQVKDWYHSVWI